MFNAGILFLLLSAGWSSDKPQVLVGMLENQDSLPVKDSLCSVRLLFAGDLMGHTPVHTAALQEDSSYDYNSCFVNIADYIRSADLAIANLEVTLAGPPYTGYPQFSAPLSFASAARDAGFDILTTANNHCMDRGKVGLEMTLKNLDSLGIPHLGTYKDTQQRMETHPMIIAKNGIRLAFLCYTYGTNGIVVKAPNVVNDLDTSLMLRDLHVTKEQQADFVIALIHWGIEYKTQASASQEKLARWLMDHGCDVIIGGHPHVVQNFTSDVNPENGRYPEPVVYSMGNLISNQRKLNCDGGVIISLELEKNEEGTSLSSYNYLSYWVDKSVVDNRMQFRIIPSVDALEYPESYSISESSYKAMHLFDSLTRARLQPADSLAFLPECRFYRNKMPLMLLSE